LSFLKETTVFPPQADPVGETPRFRHRTDPAKGGTTTSAPLQKAGNSEQSKVNS